MKRFYLLALLISFYISCYAQSFVQIYDLPFVITSIKYSGSDLYSAQQQGILRKNLDTIYIFDVQFVNECGLIDFDFAPDGFYVHLSSPDSTQRIIRLDTNTYHLDTLIEVEYKTPFSSRHRGGSVINNDSTVLASFGYGALKNDAQNLTNLRGKLISVDSFVVDVLAYGLRNPYRFDVRYDQIYIADVGSDFWEEINYLTTDEYEVNFGFPCYEGYQMFVDTCEPDILFPSYTYPHEGPQSIIGGCFWNGNYYFVDHYTRKGGFIDTIGNYTPLAVAFPQYITSMCVDSANNLVVVTFNGDVYRFEEGPLSIDEEEPEEKPEYIDYWLRKYGDTYISLDGRILRQLPEIPGLYYSWRWKRFILITNRA